MHCCCLALPPPKRCNHDWRSLPWLQCGNGESNADGLQEPTPIVGPDVNVFFAQVEAGNHFTCAQSNDGSIFCFGGSRSLDGGELNHRQG